MHHGADQIGRLPTAAPSLPAPEPNGLVQLVQQLLDSGYSWQEIGNFLLAREQNAAVTESADRMALMDYLGNINDGERDALRNQISQLPDGEFKDITREVIGGQEAPLADRMLELQRGHTQPSDTAATARQSDNQGYAPTSRGTGESALPMQFRPAADNAQALLRDVSRHDTASVATGLELRSGSTGVAASAPSQPTTMVGNLPTAAMVAGMARDGLIPASPAQSRSATNDDALASLQMAARTAPNAVASPIATSAFAQGNPVGQGAPLGSFATNGIQIPPAQVAAPAGHTGMGMVGQVSGRAPQPIGARSGLGLAWGTALPLTRARRQPALPPAQDPAAERLQWVFWGITLVAYMALAIALLAMARNGSAGLWQADGRIGFGGWALLTAIVSGIASLAFGARWGLVSRSNTDTPAPGTSTRSKGSTS